MGKRDKERREKDKGMTKGIIQMRRMNEEDRDETTVLYARIEHILLIFA